MEVEWEWLVRSVEMDLRSVLSGIEPIKEALKRTFVEVEAIFNARPQMLYVGEKNILKPIKLNYFLLGSSGGGNFTDNIVVLRLVKEQ